MTESPQTPINLTDVAKYYRETPEQAKALTYLQQNIAPDVLTQFAALWRLTPKQTIYLTLDNLYNITLTASSEKLKTFVAPLNQGFDRFGINTPLRICHFLAQVAHESDGFNAQEEYASGADYEWREDLGNTQPGDGVRFKGRGLIQVTGRANYAQISKDIGVDYVANPTRLAALPDCVNSAFWYWNSRNLSALADQDDLRGITRRVNGGYNGLSERQGYLNRAKAVLKC
jgi:predicted chitinase